MKNCDLGLSQDLINMQFFGKPLQIIQFISVCGKPLFVCNIR